MFSNSIQSYNFLSTTGKIQAFEEELISVSRERDNFQLKFVSAEAASDDSRKQKKQLEEINRLLADANNTIKIQSHEVTALKVFFSFYLLTKGSTFLYHPLIFCFDILITEPCHNSCILLFQDVIRELKSGSKSNIDASSLIDHTEIKAKLAKALEEKHTFESKFEVR